MHYYRYLHGGRVIESETPRPDLLEWAYWREVTADEAGAQGKSVQPEPTADPVTVTVEGAPEPQPVAEPPAAKKAPAKKAAPRKAAEAA
ncbi:hypothetical protein IU449_27240 [Nocardia higoensis]|uniref:Uncharacterized protein n=1 Tax=Nocardia higoensis TaxID=228599 RepID=A0ABS0DIB9_9NOCA|nr:hypothetical protein [Nocardia higoensis]MBF6358196.1 hypothetical protein [Nocardia higoensis]